MLEVAQTLDTIASKIDNINKKQEEWLAGTLSNADLRAFFDSHKELFTSMEDVERFLSGGNVTSQAYIDKYEEEQEAVAALYFYQNQLNNSLEGTADYQEAIIEIAYNRALLQSASSLASLSIEQQRYNQELAQYNNLTALGIENDTQKANLDKAKLIYIQTMISSSLSGMQDVEDEFNKRREEMDLLAGGFDDYFQVVNGVLVPIYKEMNNLTTTQVGFLDDIMNNYQEHLTEAFESFKELRDADLKEEKEKIKEKKESYQNYFKELDAMRKSEERKQSREDLVAQLQRLEGATDERSRQKALKLRQELNNLDEKSAEERTKEARVELLQSLDDSYTRLEES